MNAKRLRRSWKDAPQWNIIINCWRWNRKIVFYYSLIPQHKKRLIAIYHWCCYIDYRHKMDALYQLFVETKERFLQRGLEVFLLHTYSIHHTIFHQIWTKLYVVKCRSLWIIIEKVYFPSTYGRKKTIIFYWMNIKDS